LDVSLSAFPKAAEGRSLSTAHLQNETRDAHDDQHRADRAADIGQVRLMEHVPDEQRHRRDKDAVHDAVGG
jgi:hypothetical protein